MTAAGEVFSPVSLGNKIMLKRKPCDFKDASFCVLGLVVGMGNLQKNQMKEVSAGFVA